MNFFKPILFVFLSIIAFQFCEAQDPNVDYGNAFNEKTHSYGLNDFNIVKRKVRYSQDTMDNRGFVFGISMGVFKGNDYNANFYSGADINENNIRYITSNPYRYYEIYQYLGRNYDSVNIQPPTSMTYDIATMIGFSFHYNFKRNLGFFVNVNYAKLNTTGQFALAIDSATFTSQPALRFFPIIGMEQRTYIDIGLQKQIQIGNLANFWYEYGLSINSSSVKLSEIQVGNQTYSLVNNLINQNYVPNTQQSTYNVYQGGIGFGLFFGTGISLIVTNNVSVDPGFELYYHKMAFDGYPDFKFNYHFFVRLMMRNFL